MTNSSLSTTSDEDPAPDKEIWLQRYLGVDIVQRRQAVRAAAGGSRARSSSFSIGSDRGKVAPGPMDASAKQSFDVAYAKAQPLLRVAAAAPTPTPQISTLKKAFERDNAAMEAARLRVDYAGAEILLKALLPQAEQLKEAQVAANKQAAAAAKLSAQKAQQKVMEDTLGAVERSYFTKGGADNLSKAKLNAGKTFKAVIAALKTVESDKGAPALDALEKEAKAYLAHFESDYSDREKKTKESLRKKEVCETALTQVKHWRILADFRSAGDPPWDAVTDNKVQGANARMVFEQNLLTIPDKSSLLAKPEGQQGVSQSYWIKDTEFGTQDAKDPSKDKRNRQLFFKPMDGEEKMSGLSAGSAAIREVAGKAVGDTLKSITGFDTGMPDACLTSISNDMLAGKDDAPDPAKAGKDRLGSMQQFVQSDGSFSELARRDPQLAQRIPAKETQKVAVLDLISLNQDRHFGNAMVGNAAGANGTPPSLTPIDQGLVLPGRDGFNARRQKMLPSHNMLASLPGADEKLSPEIQQSLAMLEPKDIGDGIRNSLTALDTSHPDAHASEMIDTEAVRMAERSTAFLKHAAGELTVKQLYNALAVDSDAIFDSPDKDLDKAFDEVVAKAKDRGAALVEFAAMTDKEKKEMDADLKALGWGLDRPAASFSMLPFENAMEFEGPKLFKMWRNKTENAALKSDMLARLNELGNPSDLTLKIKDLPIGKAWLEVSKENSASRQTEQREQDATLKKDEPRLKREYDALGGDAQFEKIAKVARVSSKSLFTKFEAVRAWEEYEKLGGDAQFAKVAKITKVSGKSLFSKLDAVQAWEKYEKLGGDKVFFGMGGDGDIPLAQRIEVMEVKVLEIRGEALADD